MKTKLTTTALICCGLIAADVTIERFTGPAGTSFSLVGEAQARVGRPATPGSVAGVARRTTRRTIRRGAYVGALPRGCVRATVYGYAVWQCGSVYYQSSGGGFVVVTF